MPEEVNLSTEEALAVIRKLTEPQKAAFSRICVGDDSCLNTATAIALARKGLIDYQLVPAGGLRLLNIWRASPACIAVHIAWCQWCSETVPDEEFKA